MIYHPSIHPADQCDICNRRELQKSGWAPSPDEENYSSRPLSHFSYERYVNHGWSEEMTTGVELEKEEEREYMSREKALGPEILEYIEEKKLPPDIRVSLVNLKEFGKKDIVSQKAIVDEQIRLLHNRLTTQDHIIPSGIQRMINDFYGS